MNSDSSRLRSTGEISSDMGAIWPGALLAVYLLATSALLWRASFPSDAVPTASHLLALLAIVAATWTPRVPRWLRVSAPLVALLFLYSEMTFLIRLADHPRMFDARVERWETALFGFQPALEWATRWQSVPLSEALHAAYLSYYAVIFVVPVALFTSKRTDELPEAVFALMLTFVVCFALYLIFPVAGPRYLYAPSPLVSSGPIRRVVLGILAAGSSQGTAFPSSHVAVSVAAVLLAFRYFGKIAAILAVLVIGLGLGAIYGGFHYAVDVVAGAVLGILTMIFGVRLYAALVRRAQPKANAPT